jgi:hypothetical protein
VADDLTPEDRERIGLQRENSGLVGQRMSAIAERVPGRGRLMPEYEGGIAVRMRFYEELGARV